MPETTYFHCTDPEDNAYLSDLRSQSTVDGLTYNSANPSTAITLDNIVDAFSLYYHAPFAEHTLAAIQAHTDLTPAQLDDPTSIKDPAHPLHNLSAWRWRFSKRQGLRDRAHWRSLPTRGTYAHTWRFAAAYRPKVSLLRELGDVLGAYVRATLREPDRMDILGDLAFVVKEYQACAGTTAVTQAVRAKVPALEAYGVASGKLTYGHWRCPHWATQHSYTNITYGSSELAHLNVLPAMPGNLVHVSVDEPVKVAYVKSVRDLMRWFSSSDPDVNWVTRTTPGRYLKKFYPHLSEEVIRDLANQHVVANKPIEVKIARTESECIRVVAEGPSESCMCNHYHDNHDENRPWYRGHIHPAAIYGDSETDPTWTTDTEILYFEDEDGDVKARVICNAKTKECARIYGDADKLLPAIKRLGYTQAQFALDDARVRRIEDANGHGWIIAYIDAGTGSGGGNLHVKPSSCGRYWVPCGEDEGGVSTYLGYERKGVTEYVDSDDEDEYTEYCACCGDHYSPDEMNTVSGGAYDRVCDGCIEAEYTEAEGRRGVTGYYPDEDVVWARGDAYTIGRARDLGMDECVVTGDWFFPEDIVMTSDGPAWVERAIALDEPDDEGNDYAVEADAQLTHDGRMIHYRSAVSDTFEERVYHEDDAWVIRLCQYPVDLVVDEESFRENIHQFYVVGDTLFAQRHRPYAQGMGAIPLTEYLATFGEAGVADLARTYLLQDELEELLFTLADELTQHEEDAIAYLHAA